MRLRFNFHFVTLVLCLVLPLYAESAPMDKIKPKEFKPAQNSQPPVSPELLETVQPTEVNYSPRAFHRSPPGYLYLFDQAKVLSAGYASGVFTNDKDNKDAFFLSLQQIKYENDNTAKEYGVSLYSFGFLGLNWANKWYVNSMRDLSPYYKLGVASYYDPKDQLAAFIDYKSYVGRVGVGLENLFHSHKRLRTDFSMSVGYRGISFQLGFEYAFPENSLF